MSLPKIHKICVWTLNQGIVTFVGNGKEGNVDGIAESCEIFQPAGICTEFDNVVYFADYRTSSIKMVSSMANTALFLKALGFLMKAFSIHEKKGIFFLTTIKGIII